MEAGWQQGRVKLTSFRSRLGRHKVAILLAVVSILVFGGTFGFIAFKNKMIKSYLADFKPPAATVSSMAVRREAWRDELRAVGNVEVDRGVDVSPEVAGVIRQVSFNSGEEVKAGDVLVILDDQVEQADLRAFQAQLELARLNYARDTQLIAKKAISKTDFDAGEARLKEIEAQVQRTLALIEQKRVRAPFAGRLGIRQVNVGEFVDRGKSLVTLQALDVVHVDFNVPEQYMPHLKVGQLVNFKVQAWGDESFQGRISAVNSKVDKSTRNLLVRATLDNPDTKLLPGMFATLAVSLGEPRDRLILLDSAVSQSLYGDAVYTLIKSGEKTFKAERHSVKVGERRGRWVEVLSGVKEGEQIVTAGHIKLDSGTEVVVDNSVSLVKP